MYTKENHCQIADNILNTLKNIKNDLVDEKEYFNESFNNKLDELNSKKAPFENDIFIFSKYIEIEEYKKFNVFFNDTATTEIYTLSLHDALPI